LEERGRGICGEKRGRGKKGKKKEKGEGWEERVDDNITEMRKYR